jgi:hypothetical protein
MSYNVNLPTTGTAHPAATVDAAKAYARSRGAKRLDDVDQFITTVWDRSKAMGIRPEIAFGQWCDETGVGTSSYWKNNLNPGGLRITYDGEHSNTWADGNTAALGMLHRLSLYIYGYEHQAIPDGKQYDPAPEAVGQAGYLGIAKKLDDLSGHWAANPNYGTQIAGHLNQAFPRGDDSQGDTMKDSEGHELNMTPGLIPEAGYADRLIADANNSAWDNLGQRVVRGVTLHRMLGSLEGTDTYFRNGAAGLTDMGAKASSDLVYRWNDETGKGHQGVSANRAPWASGPYRATAYGDGLKFTNKYGVNAVNRDRRSLEIDGFYADPWSKASMQEYAQTTAHDAHNYGITWEQFPYSPKDDCSFICWHNEFCGTDYKECPGSVVMNQTDEFIGIVKGIMKAAQQGAVTPPTPTPTPPPAPTPVPVSPYPKGATEEWVKVAYGSVKVPWAAKPFAFDITRSECRAWLAYCTSTIPRGGDYTDGHWGALEKVVRRGNKGSAGRDFLYSHGFVYHQEPRAQQKGPAV